ncbi:MAG: dienelactone hydrolase family protein, partial [Rhodospirillaceae bacterium]
MPNTLLSRLAVTCAALLLTAGAHAGEVVTYTTGGEQFEGYMASAEDGSNGMVLIVHDWDGLTDYEMKRADMLAEMGYNALAIDLFGKGNRPPDVAGRRAETGKLYKDRARMRSLILAGLAEARKRFK